MERVGIRELHVHTSALVRRAAAGETIEVTDHGRPVVRLVALRRESGIEQLLAQGRVTPPEIDLLDVHPEALEPGERSPSEVLAEMRADER
ncbi:MAG: type II toxin-antitoxin system prevent-host-death family antitoxin [Candidatus Dormibacteraeota bacterium]|nr:type II toxin-antitoxin system prevent-host-death family antitoxin [Candidatus Dormibacteraeota bacterium]